MKFQVEIISYFLFSALIFILLSFFVYYFLSFSNNVTKSANKINLYSIINILESPIIIFSSVCNLCSIEFYLQMNHSQPQNFLFSLNTVLNLNNLKIKYEELYSEYVITSPIFNLNNIYFLDINANSMKKIHLIIDKLTNSIIIKNI